MVPPELAPLTDWLCAASRNNYGYSGDGGKVWILPESFDLVFGFTLEGATLNLYCHQSELNWLAPAGRCTARLVDDISLIFWFLNKVAFVLPMPPSASVNLAEKVALHLNSDAMAPPVKTFDIRPCSGHKCAWPVSTPRFHFFP